MRLKSGGRVHQVVRKSPTQFEVDGALVEVNDSKAPASRRTGAFVARDGDQVFAQVGGRSYRMIVVTRSAAAAADHATTEGELEAPMPGRVTRVAVAVGDAVKRGQELIVVEAMEMENALVAPFDGVVKTLDVRVGEMVAPGPTLLMIEPAS